MNTHAIKLDIDKRRAVLEPIVIAQGDKNGTTIQATIYDAGTLVTTQGLTARFRMRLPDGRHFYEKTATWSYSTGTASVTIDETQAASVAGTTHECYFVLLNGSTVVHSTSRFAIRVLRDATDGIAATSYSDRLEDLLDELGDLPLPADTTPVMDGNAYKGSSTRYARQDHRHPTDTTRAPLASPALTGSPTAPTPAQSDDGTRIATTHWVRGMASTSSPAMDGSASYGSSAYYARADHRHPTDTTRAAASDLATHVGDSTAHVTDVERSVWDAKASTDTATNVTNGLMSAADKVKLDGIDSGANAYSLPPATDSSLGGVIPDGTTITVDSDGTIHGASTYELPTMTTTTKGGAKLGRGLEVTDGVLSVSTEGDGAIRSVTAEGWAEQDGTPSPSSPVPIQVARGRNLLDESMLEQGAYKSADGTIMSSTGYVRTPKIPCEAGRAYTASSAYPFAAASSIFCFWKADGTFISATTGATATAPSGAVKLGYSFRSYNNGTHTPSDMSNTQLESGSTATPYVPYGHVGLEVRGRNLLPRFSGGTVGGITATARDDGSVVVNGTASATVTFSSSVTLAAGTYTLSGCPANGSDTTYKMDAPAIASIQDRGEGSAFTIATERELAFRIRIGSGATVSNVVFRPQLESGTEATEYIPYHDVTIPIPLPSKGFAASLPDGTHDTLTIDGAGHVEWESAVGRIESYAGESVGSVYLSTTGDLTTGAEVLYPLATPTTEDMGYVTLPITTEGDTVDIPELEDVAVVRWADTVATEVAQAWYRRAQAVESRVAALEAAVAELVANG